MHLEPPSCLTQWRGRVALGLLAVLLSIGGCGNRPQEVPLKVPRGFLDSIEFVHEGQLLGFGPFVGYYFRPVEPGNWRRLKVVCFNEDRFYASDMPANAKLYEGEAVLTTLPEADMAVSTTARMQPIYFPVAPAAWRASRPEPQDEFLHFHSCYNAAGPVRTGFWVRHVAQAAFTYDMGGRVTAASPLHHRVQPGVDKAFARIIEFDRGPR